MGDAAAKSHSPKVTQHFGRGGAGNVRPKEAQSPLLVPEGTPTLKSKNYTTGRGGTGNMAKNDDAEQARLAQDVDVPGIVLTEGPAHTGRGGAANVYVPTEEERLAAKENNERLRRESNGKRDRSGIRGLADKGKELLTGSKKADH